MDYNDLALLFHEYILNIMDYHLQTSKYDLPKIIGLFWLIQSRQLWLNKNNVK